MITGSFVSSMIRPGALDEGQDQEEGADSTESGPTERVRALIHEGLRRDGLE